MVAETLWRYGPHHRDTDQQIDVETGTVPRELHSGRVAITPAEADEKVCVASPRPISTGQLHVLPRFHFRPINPVV